jgi:hypothetical protein
MKPVIFECDTTSQIPVDRIADAFAQTSSDDQAVFLQEIFDALLHKCNGSMHSLRVQLGYVANEMHSRGFKQGIEGVRMLQEEIESEK